MAGLRLELGVEHEPNHVRRHAHQGGQSLQRRLQMRTICRKHGGIQRAHNVPNWIKFNTYMK